VTEARYTPEGLEVATLHAPYNVNANVDL